MEVGKLKDIKELPISNFNERPLGVLITTIVIHSMYVPEFGPNDFFDVQRCVEVLQREGVSAHYMISRDGIIVRCVDESKRAWHAGVSKMPFPDDSRENVNDFSIGVELIGAPDLEFTDMQYKALNQLIAKLASSYPINEIVGHDHISPDRKTDPGARFSWERVKAIFPKLRFNSSI